MNSEVSLINSDIARGLKPKNRESFKFANVPMAAEVVAELNATWYEESAFKADCVISIAVQESVRNPGPRIDLARFNLPNITDFRTFYLEPQEAAQLVKRGSSALNWLNDRANAAYRIPEILESIRLAEGMEPLERASIYILLEQHALQRERLFGILINGLSDLIPSSQRIETQNTEDKIINIRSSVASLLEHPDEQTRLACLDIVNSWFHNISDNYSRLSHGATTTEIDLARTSAISLVQDRLAKQTQIGSLAEALYKLDWGIRLVQAFLEDSCSIALMQNSSSCASYQAEEIFSQAMKFYFDRQLLAPQLIEPFILWSETNQMLVEAVDVHKTQLPA